PAVREQSAEFQLRCVRRELELCERVAGSFELLSLHRSFDACDRGFRLCVLRRRLAGLEERRVDPEPVCEPGEHLAGRPRLAALDLAQVLLRAAVAGELRLGEAGADAELAQASAQCRGWPGLRAKRRCS